MFALIAGRKSVAATLAAAPNVCIVACRAIPARATEAVALVVRVPLATGAVAADHAWPVIGCMSRPGSPLASAKADHIRPGDRRRVRRAQRPPFGALAMPDTPHSHAWIERAIGSTGHDANPTAVHGFIPQPVDVRNKSRHDDKAGGGAASPLSSGSTSSPTMRSSSPSGKPGAPSGRPSSGSPGGTSPLEKWRTRHDSNVRPLPSEGSALSG